MNSVRDADADSDDSLSPAPAPCPPAGLIRILESPGLRFLLSDILLRLDGVSMAHAELVSKQWRNLFLQERLWRARLLGTTAPTGSYQRHLVMDRSPEFQAALSTHSSFVDSCESSRMLRRLCWRIEGGGLSREWTRPTRRDRLKPFKVKHVSNARIVRDLKVSGDLIAFATGTAIHLGSRQLITSQQS